MTKKQKEVMDFLKDYLKKNGVAPTMKEVGKYFNVSIPSVQSHFKNLEKKGYLTRTPNNSRGIIIKGNPKKVIVTSELIKKIQELESRIASLETLNNQIKYLKVPYTPPENRLSNFK